MNSNKTPSSANRTIPNAFSSSLQGMTNINDNHNNQQPDYGSMFQRPAISSKAMCLQIIEEALDLVHDDLFSLDQDELLLSGDESGGSARD